MKKSILTALLITSYISGFSQEKKDTTQSKPEVIFLAMSPSQVESIYKQLSLSSAPYADVNTSVSIISGQYNNQKGIIEAIGKYLCKSDTAIIPRKHKYFLFLLISHILNQQK